MVVDLRQVMAAILTFSMFVMLGNMIKRDHIDPFWETVPESPTIVQYDVLKVSKPRMLKLTEDSYGPWKENDEAVKPCWKKALLIKGKVQSNGYIFFSLTNGPEYHASQIANAVTVARHLGATLALPEIKGTKLREKKKFGEIYDVEKFITSLDGVVRIDKNPPFELSNGRLPILRIPDRVSENFIFSNIKPIFHSKRNIKLVTYFNSSTITKGMHHNPYQCQAMFDSLKLQTELQELVDSMVGTLQSLSQKMNGRFIAVDLKAKVQGKKGCRGTDSTSRRCYDAQEIGEFLKKIGFHKDTTIYLTQTGWDSSLNALRNVFPNTFTKDAIMPAYEKAKFTDSESHKYEKFIDYYMCAEADVFVPSLLNRFYAGVVGQRIALGKTQVFVPAKKVSTAADDYVSSYILKKSHFAHSCFC